MGHYVSAASRSNTNVLGRMVTIDQHWVPSIVVRDFAASSTCLLKPSNPLLLFQSRKHNQV